MEVQNSHFGAKAPLLHTLALLKFVGDGSISTQSGALKQGSESYFKCERYKSPVNMNSNIAFHNDQ